MATSKTAQELEAYFERMELRNAPAWRPEPGTTIRAKCIGLTVRESDYGPYPCIVYRNVDTGEALTVHAFHRVLRDRLQELGTEPGKEQYLTYLGLREFADKRTEKGSDVTQKYHHYDAENVGEESTVEDKTFTWTLPGDKD